MKVIAISGSLRKESYTTKLVRAFQKATPEGLTFEMVEIGGLPLFNQDLENDLPPVVRDFKATIEGADAVLLATPEHNRSVPAAMKNALDWGSRPAGNNSWGGLPTGVVSCTPGHLGAFGANHHLRQSLVFLDMPPMQQPEFYLSDAASKFNDAGELTDDATKQHIDAFWQAFVVWINKNHRA